MAAPLVLHVWPGRWNLHSINAACLEAILFLQLVLPGRYSLVETADPDLSPSGQLPFLTHGQIAVSPLPSIISYLTSLDHSWIGPRGSSDEDEIDPAPKKIDLDAGLSVLQLSQKPAWRAYIEAQLGDLVAHSFFVLEPNFSFTHSTLASMLPVPQRYYVPRRIKETYRPRLEAVGLWQIANEPERPQENQGVKKHKGETNEEKIKRAFGQAKLVEKARLVFDILSKLLGDGAFIFNDRPTSVDLALASQILLLAHVPLPNRALKELLTASYPSLLSHASRVHALTFPASPSDTNPRPQILTPPRVNPLNVLKSSLMHLTRPAVNHSAEESEEAKRFRRYRWGWFALAVAGAVGFIVTQGSPISIVFVPNSEDDPRELEEVGEEQEVPPSEEVLDVDI